jgi:hypothetical protein
MGRKWLGWTSGWQPAVRWADFQPFGPLVQYISRRAGCPSASSPLPAIPLAAAPTVAAAFSPTLATARAPPPPFRHPRRRPDPHPRRRPEPHHRRSPLPFPPRRTFRFWHHGGSPSVGNRSHPGPDPADRRPPSSTVSRRRLPSGSSRLAFSE